MRKSSLPSSFLSRIFLGTSSIHHLSSFLGTPESHTVAQYIHFLKFRVHTWLIIVYYIALRVHIFLPPLGIYKVFAYSHTFE